MGMNAVISRKYGWNTIAWMENHVSGTLSSKIYWVSKSIPAAKPQNFVEISEAQKLHGQNIWNLIFFYLKRQGYIDITRTKINLGSHHLHTQFL